MCFKYVIKSIARYRASHLLKKCPLFYLPGNQVKHLNSLRVQTAQFLQRYSEVQVHTCRQIMPGAQTLAMEWSVHRPTQFTDSHDTHKLQNK
jgi:hypothetical protein